MLKKLIQLKNRRAERIRAKIKGNAEKPRLTVFRSNKFVYAQLIDDEKRNTLVSASTLASKDKGTKVEKAMKIGEKLAEKALAKGIKKAVFDRKGYKYHGRVKAVAEGARKGGLEF